MELVLTSRNAYSLRSPTCVRFDMEDLPPRYSMLEAAGWPQDGVKIKGNKNTHPFRHGKRSFC